VKIGVHLHGALNLRADGPQFGQKVTSHADAADFACALARDAQSVETPAHFSRILPV